MIEHLASYLYALIKLISRESGQKITPPRLSDEKGTWELVTGMFTVVIIKINKYTFETYAISCKFVKSSDCQGRLTLIEPNNGKNMWIKYG